MQKRHSAKNSVSCYQAVIRGTWRDARPSTSRVQLRGTARGFSRVGCDDHGQFAKHPVPAAEPIRAVCALQDFLLCCSLPYWLIVVRRPALRLRRQMVLLAVGALVVEWAAIFGNCTAVFGEGTFPGPYDRLCNNLDQYTWPPATILAAFLVSWVVTTQVLRRFRRQA